MSEFSPGLSFFVRLRSPFFLPKQLLSAVSVSRQQVTKYLRTLTVCSTSLLRGEKNLSQAVLREIQDYFPFGSFKNTGKLRDTAKNQDCHLHQCQIKVTVCPWAIHSTILRSYFSHRQVQLIHFSLETICDLINTMGKMLSLLSVNLISFLYLLKGDVAFQDLLDNL